MSVEYSKYNKGELLHDKYLKIHDISEGSFGIVSLAKDVTNNNKLVAVKYITQLPNDQSDSEQEEENEENEDEDVARHNKINEDTDDDNDTELPQSRLKKKNAKKLISRSVILREAEQEIRVLQRIGQHPYITELYDSFDEFIIMEYCSRGDLYDAIRTNMVPVSTKDVVDSFLQLISAVEYAHSIGIYHRDIKPENILIDDDWSLKLTDWGLATDQKFCTDFDVGSERYMAPELLSHEDIDVYDAEKVDIWSLGICLLNVVFGKNPFTSASEKDKLFMHFASNREALFDIFPSMSYDLFTTLRFSLTIDPDNRDLQMMKEALMKIEHLTIDFEFNEMDERETISDPENNYAIAEDDEDDMDDELYEGERSDELSDESAVANIENIAPFTPEDENKLNKTEIADVHGGDGNTIADISTNAVIKNNEIERKSPAVIPIVSHTPETNTKDTISNNVNSSDSESNTSDTKNRLIVPPQSPKRFNRYSFNKNKNIVKINKYQNNSHNGGNTYLNNSHNNNNNNHNNNNNNTMFNNSHNNNNNFRRGGSRKRNIVRKPLAIPTYRNNKYNFNMNNNYNVTGNKRRGSHSGNNSNNNHGNMHSSYDNAKNYRRLDNFTPKSVFNQYMDKAAQKLGYYDNNNNNNNHNNNHMPSHRKYRTNDSIFNNSNSLSSSMNNNNIHPRQGWRRNYNHRNSTSTNFGKVKVNSRQQQQSKFSSSYKNYNSDQLNIHNNFPGFASDNHSHNQYNSFGNKGNSHGHYISHGKSLNHHDSSNGPALKNSFKTPGSLGTSGKYIPPNLRSPAQPHIKSPLSKPATKPIGFEDTFELELDNELDANDGVFMLEDDFESHNTNNNNKNQISHVRSNTGDRNERKSFSIHNEGNVITKNTNTTVNGNNIVKNKPKISNFLRYTEIQNDSLAKPPTIASIAATLPTTHTTLATTNGFSPILAPSITLSTSNINATSTTSLKSLLNSSAAVVSNSSQSKPVSNLTSNVKNTLDSSSSSGTVFTNVTSSTYNTVDSSQQNADSDLKKPVYVPPHHRRNSHSSTMAPSTTRILGVLKRQEKNFNKFESTNHPDIDSLHMDNSLDVGKHNKDNISHAETEPDNSNNTNIKNDSNLNSTISDNINNINQRASKTFLIGPDDSNLSASVPIEKTNWFDYDPFDENSFEFEDDWYNSEEFSIEQDTSDKSNFTSHHDTKDFKSRSSSKRFSIKGINGTTVSRTPTNNFSGRYINNNSMKASGNVTSSVNTNPDNKFLNERISVLDVNETSEENETGEENDDNIIKNEQSITNSDLIKNFNKSLNVA
ncbi:hypothetical protein B5S31_g2211 [[Candida] boidinii]|nr:hypothetical protein B5S29_g2691 [[Candida] boidinii]OWB72497.1 hypothetical protein B5S31_g2211 [[Candida] boidinii]